MTGLFPFGLFGDNSKTSKNDIVVLCKYCDENTKDLNMGYINNVMTNNIKDTGAYIVIINTRSIINGPNGVFAISKNNMMNKGNITVLNYSKGQDCELRLEWDECEYPKLIYYINPSFYINNKKFSNGYKIICEIKII